MITMLSARHRMLLLRTSAVVLARTPLAGSTLQGVIVERVIGAEKVLRRALAVPAALGVRRRRRVDPVHFHDGGEGPAVLLLNGWTASGLAWPRQLVHGLEQDHRVIRIDNRGSGHSQRTPVPFTVADLAEDAAAILDRAGIGQATVVGLSLGGMIAQELAIRRPDLVGHLVLLGTGPPMPALTWPRTGVMRNLLAERVADGDAREAARDTWVGLATAAAFADRTEDVDELIDSLLERRTPMHGLLAQGRAAAGWHGAHRLRRIAAPTSVIHGFDDNLLPVRNGRCLANLIPGARYIELAGVGHLVAHEAPDVVAETIRRHPAKETR
jgi:3-oxoadipate enol-lactonase